MPPRFRGNLTGIGVTGGGTRIPIAEVIRLAAHAHHSLAVFDKATGSALDLFRARRVASPAQRIMLIARDGGCTKPGCTVGAYGSQAHHVVADWTDGGNTNVDELGLACGPDNRAVGPEGWSTRMNERGEVEWIPPPALDTGQTRINTYHRPERLLRPPDQEPPSSPDAGLQSDGGPAETTPSSHHDQPGETPRAGREPIDHELTGDEPIDHELTDHELIDYELVGDEPNNDKPSGDKQIDDNPIDYELTEPSASNNPEGPEEPDEPCEPGEPGDPGDPDKPDKSRGPDQPGGPAPPGGQAA